VRSGSPVSTTAQRRYAPHPKLDYRQQFRRSASSPRTHGRPGASISTSKTAEPLAMPADQCFGLNDGQNLAPRQTAWTRVKRVAAFARRGLNWRSRYKAYCLGRKKFSAARRHCGCRLAPMSLSESSNRSKVFRSSPKKRRSFGIHDKIAHPGHCRHQSLSIATYRIIADYKGGRREQNDRGSAVTDHAEPGNRLVIGASDPWVRDCGTVFSEACWQARSADCLLSRTQRHFQRQYRRPTGPVRLLATSASRS
jgi:hypothetical protein